MARSINYGHLMHKAFRQVMSDVLTDVAEHGLPGDHHFYINFDTTHPGVDMSDDLRRRYPEEMMVVLQDWFADLAVTPERFSVTLNFGNVPEPIVVPFNAVKTFVDPSVEFGLKFDSQEGDEDSDNEFVIGDGFSDSEDEDDAPATENDARNQGDAEVVSLDKFRKH